MCYVPAGDGSCTATWTPPLEDTGNYNVYAWWVAKSNRATNAKYTVYYNGGSETVKVNQEWNGSQWNLLGNFPFAAGTSGYVVLSDDANEYVVADAIKWELGEPPPPPPFDGIVDTPDAEFVCDWTCVITPGAYPDDGTGTMCYVPAGDGSCTATWTPPLGEAGNYNVYAWWRSHPNRASNVKYTIYYDGGSETVEISQKVNGRKWNLLGTYDFVAGTSGYVVLSDDANGYVIADAIKWEEVQP